MDYQAKIKTTQQKIQDYQTQYPKRNEEQKRQLSILWLELLYWQLAEKGEIKPDSLFFKAQEFWQNLKKIYQRQGKWPYTELETFLNQQPSQYTTYLINLIQQESQLEYLKFARWLNKKFK